MIRRCRSRGITKVEVLVVIAIIALLISILIPIIDRMRQNERRPRCGSHLRQIGQALLLYANDNRGHYPCVRAAADDNATPVWGTGTAATNPFADDGPSPGDVTAALFLLIRTQDLYPEAFCCDSTDATPDKYDGKPPQQRSNFTDWRKNLSYSFQNPHRPRTNPPDRKYIGDVARDFAIAADMNPGTSGKNENVLSPTMNSSAQEMRSGNSRNHDHDGQNILYADGHVAWESNPFIGYKRDNIYTTADTKVLAPPLTEEDSIFLPTDD